MLEVQQRNFDFVKHNATTVVVCDRLGAVRGVVELESGTERINTKMYQCDSTKYAIFNFMFGTYEWLMCLCFGRW